MDCAGLIVRDALQHTTQHSTGEAQRIGEQRAAYATGTTGTVTAAVLLMEKETVHS